ncbi:hypothetical protein SAMN06296386_104115 [Lachnospiraceae bacterium]|nr:hypothetical protein SAMN06296386_104115 [Lachnospiraceae bacterium]
MKNKFLSLLIAGVLCASLLMGCGGGDTNDKAPAEAPAQEETQAEEAEEAEAPAKAVGEKADLKEESSELTFEDLQDNYKTLTEIYDTVNDLYMNDKIAQSDSVEKNMSDAKDLIEEMGELSEDDFNGQEDYKTLNDAMITTAEALQMIIDQMETVDDAEPAVSNTDVRNMYQKLVNTYNELIDTYADDAVAQNDDLEELLQSSRQAIDIYGDIDLSDLSAEKKLETYNNLSQLVDALEEVIRVLK